MLNHAFLSWFSKKATTLICIIFVTGCALPVYKAYEGPDLPTSEVVTIHNTSQLAFWSFAKIYKVDGLQLKQPAREIAIRQGPHWYQVLVTRRSKAAMFLLTDGFYLDAICAFILDSAPGTAYTLGSVDKGSQESANEHKVYKASLEIEERSADGSIETRLMPIECVSLENSGAYSLLCRDNADCLTEGAKCIREADFSNGVCLNP